MKTHAVRLVHLTIRRDWREVYALASDPLSMPRWAEGLSATMRRDGEDYVADGGPIGAIRIRFTPDNAYGVIDHTVTFEDGRRFYNALRVQPNGDGAEVIFTLLRMEDTPDADFERDAEAVAADLRRLKALCEA
ncbi:SRPBCC family protein [Gellertiella hungarica]|uniref:Polyketide cyclase n=1 Tax=Gellertiella hungarica TaxID=1572859 RepID=A0A7W6J8Y3_9HYPH|nr:SRPBCC family protein [Gellertiella hungarica]MBB4066975.1 hypothetical protein [Gellertiella hungarica]